MKMYVECDRCRYRFIMRYAAQGGGLIRVRCPQCRETMVLLVHTEVAARHRS